MFIRAENYWDFRNMRDHSEIIALIIVALAVIVLAARYFFAKKKECCNKGCGSNSKG